MKIYSNGVVDGYISDEFGKRGTQFIKDKKPSYSLPVSWQDVPRQAKSLALVFLDHDAIPVCGFTWIHWLVANIDPKLDGQTLVANASVTMDLLQGTTSWASGLLDEKWSLEPKEAIGYGGCAPPDITHIYTLELYALDCMLGLNQGFYYNELIHAMDGHILDVASLKAKYKA